MKPMVESESKDPRDAENERLRAEVERLQKSEDERTGVIDSALCAEIDRLRAQLETARAFLEEAHEHIPGVGVRDLYGRVEMFLRQLDPKPIMMGTVCAGSAQSTQPAVRVDGPKSGSTPGDPSATYIGDPQEPPVCLQHATQPNPFETERERFDRINRSRVRVLQRLADRWLREVSNDK